MRGLILRKEIVWHVLTLRFGVTFALSLSLVFASAYVTTSQYQQDVEAHSAWVREGAARMDRIFAEKDSEERFERLLYREGRLDAVPVSPLGGIVQGLRSVRPVAFDTRAHDFRSIGRGVHQNPLAGLLGVPDVVYVVSVVLSLLAVLFAFDCVCGEKESGTLRLTMSNAVPRDAVLLGKWLGGYLVLIVPFLIAMIGGLGYAWWRGALILTGENMARLAMLLAMACLYVSVFFSLGLLVSTLTHRATTSLFICLLVWVVWILVIPNLAPVVARILVPAPSRQKIEAEKSAIQREAWLRINRLEAAGAYQHGQTVKRKREKILAESRRRQRRWDRFFDEAHRRQTELAETLGRLSPSACWVYSAVALTGTGPESYKRLQQAQERLRKEMANLRDRFRRERDREDKLSDLAPADVPHLEYSAPRLDEAVGATLNDALILAILGVVFFLGAFLFFLRYDVR